MSQVSIIVPVYNVHPYLNRCVESVLAQTFPDYELILIDDGSTDGSGELCDQWAEQDSRIQVVHTENHGLPSARNTGVQHSSAPLVTFVDSDDTINPFHLEYHLRAMHELRADCVLASHQRVTEQEAIDYSKPEYSAISWAEDRALHELAAGDMWASAVNILAPRSWYLETPFPEGTLYEDRAHTHKIYLKSQFAVYVDAVLYYYLIRDNTISHSRSSSIKLCKDFQSNIQIAQHDLLASGRVCEEDIAVMVCRDCISLYLTSMRCNEATEEAAEVGKWALEVLHRYGRKAMCNPSAPKAVRLRIGLILFSPSIYRTLDRLVKKRKGWVC